MFQYFVIEINTIININFNFFNKHWLHYLKVPLWKIQYLYFFLWILIEICNILLIIFNFLYFLDFGVDLLTDFAVQTTFPWLISNVIDNETGKPLANGHVTYILENKGKKVNWF